MTSEITYFCDSCQRVIEGDKVAIQVTVDIKGTEVPGMDAHNFVTGQRYETKNVHFHPSCSTELLIHIQRAVAPNEVKVPTP